MDLKMIMFLCCSLSSIERNYSQIGKEALSIALNVKQFYQYIRYFHLVTDHKPVFVSLIIILLCLAIRKIHYATFLQTFNSSVKCSTSKGRINAYVLLRLSLYYFNNSFSEVDVYNIFYTETVPMTASDIAKTTKLEKNLYENFECLLNDSIKLL